MQDVWSLGVIVYEALTDTRAISPFANWASVHALARGTLYPWEERTAPMVFAKSRVAGLVRDCLQRNAAARPTAQQILERIERLGMRSTMTMTTTSV